ncbi:MAG: glycosyltransferase [Gloeomargaritaceae cyanobacterium C42_A2020_066]|nr:glycosyltransferase [Gloeomargaritaceae cyanobacterium C42_A2020_066]
MSSIAVGRHSVGVLVDLVWHPQAGGHVKCWERFAEAAATADLNLDLTVYYLGPAEKVIPLTEHVRYHLLPPVLGTDRFPFLRQGGGDTDLAPYHPRLAHLLRRHHILHTTDVFTFAQTAGRVARRHQIPLVSSLHTDLPKFTRIYAREIIGRLLPGVLNRFAFDRLRLDEMLAADMARKLRRYMAQSDQVLVSNPEDLSWVSALVPPERISRLRRGIDAERFHPRWRDRTRLAQTYGIDPDVPLLLFVGRVDPSKGADILAQAARRLLDQGHRLHVLMVGAGASRPAVQALLQEHVTLPGALPQTDLPWIYASADAFVFPSQTDVLPNVVLEAKAAGRPVFVSAGDGAAQLIGMSGRDGLIVPSTHPAFWAAEIQPYLIEPSVLQEMGAAARHWVEHTWPTWLTVLQEDLFPVWQKLVRSEDSSDVPRHNMLG